jgi:hypothetical protein
MDGKLLETLVMKILGPKIMLEKIFILPLFAVTANFDQKATLKALHRTRHAGAGRTIMYIS